MFILNKFLAVGSKWALICKELPRRSNNSVRNRFHLLTEKKPMEDINREYLLGIIRNLQRKNPGLGAVMEVEREKEKQEVIPT